MTKTIHVRVVTNEGQVVAAEAVSVRAPGELGNLGVLYNHAPLVTTISPGTFIWRQPDGTSRLVMVESGLLEIAKNRLTLLTDAVSEPRPLGPTG